MVSNCVLLKQASRFLFLALSVIVSGSCATMPSEDPVAETHTTIVFVHGAWGGGWQYTRVQPLLEDAGYTVYRPTMTGLGERVHLSGPEIGLSTHIEDIVKVLEFEDLHDIVLVGHSYGGMVITGVADRVPDRIAMMVYFDALLPENGESVAMLAGDLIERLVTTGGDGAEPWQLVPAWVPEGKQPPVDVPQPLLTFTETLDLENSKSAAVPAAFLLTVESGKDGDDFDVFAARARSRGWRVYTMEGTHNPHWFQPEAFVEVLLQIVSK